MSKPVTLEQVENIGVVTINNPPINALGQLVRQGLMECFSEAADNDSIEAILLHCSGRTFVAGADISEFDSGNIGNPDLNEVYAIIEAIPKPVIAAIHGTALGGGMELALSCHYRVALPTARVGLPEVTLGLLPGAGGTQRLPRLIGPEKALEIMLSGKPVAAADALSLGLIDSVLVADSGEVLLQLTIDYAIKLIAENAPCPQASKQDIDPDSLPADFFEAVRQSNAKASRGYFAPEKIIQCVEAAVTMPFEEGVKYERQLFLECMASPQSAALRHLFFAERVAAKIPDIPKETAIRPIKTVGIIGAGTMGGGIAMNFASAGIPVVMLELQQEALDRGLGIVRKNYENTAKKGRMSTAQVEQCMAQFQGTTSYDDLANCDLIIEAAFENMAVKEQIFAKLGEVCKAGAILASNTSTLDVDQIAAASGRPQDVLGMHFFSPANVMRLLEVVRGAETADDALATVMKLAKTIKKVAVVSGVCPGFIVNRMLYPYLHEAENLLLEGASPSQVDCAIESFGMVMGPFRMIDMSGIDVAAKVRMEEKKVGIENKDPRYGVLSHKLFEMNRLGQKTGAGFYQYDGRTPIHDPELMALSAETAAEFGIVRRDDISDEEIVKRCFYPVFNEGFKILEEGIAIRSGDIDIAWQYGLGFPRYLGGPMHHVNATGTSIIYQEMIKLGETLGNNYNFWTPAKLLAELAESNSPVK